MHHALSHTSRSSPLRQSLPARRRTARSPAAFAPTKWCLPLRPVLVEPSPRAAVDRDDAGDVGSSPRPTGCIGARTLFSSRGDLFLLASCARAREPLLLLILAGSHPSSYMLTRWARTPKRGRNRASIVGSGAAVIAATCTAAAITGEDTTRLPCPRIAGCALRVRRDISPTDTVHVSIVLRVGPLGPPPPPPPPPPSRWLRSSRTRERLRMSVQLPWDTPSPVLAGAPMSSRMHNWRTLIC